MLALDINSYPHIIESIISYADPSVLRVLRLTSRSLWRTITAESARHMAAVSLPGPYPHTSMRSKDGVLVFPFQELRNSNRHHYFTKTLQHTKLLLHAATYKYHCIPSIIDTMSLDVMAVTNLLHKGISNPLPRAKTVISCSASGVIDLPTCVERVIVLGLLVPTFRSDSDIRVPEIIVIIPPPSPIQAHDRIITTAMTVASYLCPVDDRMGVPPTVAFDRVVVANVDDAEEFTGLLRHVRNVRGDQGDDMDRVRCIIGKGVLENLSEVERIVVEMFCQW